MIRIIVFLCVIILFSSCGGKFDGFTELSEDVHVKLLAFDDKGSRSLSDSAEFVQLSFSWKFLGDAEKAPNYTRTYKNLNLEAIGNEELWNDLLTREVGDSLEYLMSCERWGQSVLSSEFDVDCENRNDQMIQLNLAIQKISTKTEYASDRELLNFSEPGEELKYLEQFLEGESDIERIGELFLERYTHRSKGKKIEKDSLLRLRYEGYFLNGSRFDRSPPDSGLVFRKGEQGQVLRGIELAISQCSYGDSIGVYLPPYLAFGARGSGNGIVPPYTPVFYVLKVDSLN